MSEKAYPTADDRQFEDYLAGRSRLSARYRAASLDEPSETMDRAIRAQAGEAAGSRADAGWKRWWSSFPGAAPRVVWAIASLVAAGILAVHLAPLEMFRVPEGEATPASPVSTMQSPRAAQVPATAPPKAASIDESTAPHSIPAPTAARVALPAPARGARDVDDASAPVADSPDAWLAEIERLLAEGHQDQARVGFYALRERFPDHPVPEDLLDRLGM